MNQVSPVPPASPHPFAPSVRVRGKGRSIAMFGVILALVLGITFTHEAGTPFGVTIDFDTIGENGDETKDTVTLRERDSMEQRRVKIEDLLGILLKEIM